MSIKLYTILIIPYSLFPLKGANLQTLFISDKNIINEQFLLNRLAAAAIDIYVTTCMLSRCTQSLNQGLPSAMHEELLTKV